MLTRLGALFGLSIALLSLTGCSGDDDSPGASTTSREVGVTDVEVGTGPEVKEGDLVWVTYRGTHDIVGEDGSVEVFQFDSNMDDIESQMPYMFEVSPRGQVIPGWKEGIVGAKAGGKRLLDIPSEKAYGTRGSDPIPPNQDLDFEINVLYVFRPEFKEIFDIEEDIEGSGAMVEEGDEITIHYRGTYLTGKRWDDTRERGEPVTLTVGDKKAILGLEYGVIGMKEGGKRTIVVPHTLAFDAVGTQWVQGMQPLRIEIEVLKVNG